MVQGQYTLCVLFTDIVLSGLFFCALALFAETEPAHNSNILDSVTTNIFLEY